MAMQTRQVTRATAPDLHALNVTLQPLLAVANAGVFYLRYGDGVVVIEQASFTGVDMAAVSAAVAAAPVATPYTQAKADVDTLPLVQKAIVLLLLDQINQLRQNPTTVLPAITEQQMWNAIRNRVDSLTP